MNNKRIIKILSKSIISTFEKNVSIVCDICESEIEKVFLLKLIDYVIKRQNAFSLEIIYEDRDETFVNNDGIPYVHPEVNYQAPDTFGRLSGIKIKDIYKNGCYFEIFPQYKISYEDIKGNSLKETNYRLDFGVFKYSNNDNKLLTKYCIECDGHEFHSKKHQIKNDNKRMKNLLFRKKYTTIKYSGSEIYYLNESDLGTLIMTLGHITSDY